MPLFLLALVLILSKLNKEQDKIYKAYRLTYWSVLSTIFKAIQEETESNNYYEEKPDLPDVIYCNGTAIDWNTSTAEIIFDQLAAKAIEKKIYNSKNLDEGGWEELWIDYFRVRGNSLQRSEELVLEAISLDKIPPLSSVC